VRKSSENLKLQAMRTFETDVLKCDKCFPIEGKRVLLGRGNLNAEIMFVGWAPYIHKEGRGQVFGSYAPSGKVFNELIKHLKIKDYWTTNLIKCSVPHVKLGNASNCLGFLKREIEIVNPKVVVLFGRDTVKNVLASDYSLNGTIITKDKRKYVCLWHPASIMRGRVSLTKFLETSKQIIRAMHGGLDAWL